MKKEITDVQLMAKALDHLERLASHNAREGLPWASISTLAKQLRNRLKDTPDAFKTRPQLRIVIGMHGVVQAHELQAADIALSITASGHVNVYKNDWGPAAYKTVDDALVMIRDIVDKRVKAQPEDLDEPDE